MKKYIKLLVVFAGICLIFGSTNTANISFAQEEENIADDPAIQQALTQILLDPSILQEGVTTTPAWLSYAFARLVWVKNNAEEPVTNENYVHYYEEELIGRESLIKVWEELQEQDPTLQDKYLDEMVIIYKAGYLPEYVWFFTYFDEGGTPPEDARVEEFEMWFTPKFIDHQPETLAGLIWEVNEENETGQN